MNRFDEAIALQKLRKKKEEEDDIRYRMIHRNEMESLKKNVDINYNKEFTNLQNRKNNEIEMIKKEKDNIDLYIFKCPENNGYHITSHPFKNEK